MKEVFFISDTVTLFHVRLLTCFTFFILYEVQERGHGGKGDPHHFLHF